MKLKEKLFLSLGLLIVLLGALFYLAFIFFFRSNLNDTKKDVHSLFIEQSQHERVQEITYFKQRVESEKENLNALYYYFSFGEDNLNAWPLLASFLAENPDMGFVQLRDIKKNQVFSIIPAPAPLYPVTTFAMNDNFLFVILPTFEKSQDEENLFLAYPTPKSTYSPYPTYLLFSWKDLGSAVKEFFSDLDKVNPASLPLHQTVEEKESIEKLTMLKALAPFYAKGLEIIPEKGNKIPSGVAYLSSDGKGKALLANNLFQERAFFEDVAYFREHRAPNESGPANGTAVIKTDDEIFLGNTFGYDSFLVTIGFPVSELLKELAVVSNQVVVLSSDNLKLGFAPNGERLSGSQLQTTLDSLKGKSETFYSRATFLSDNGLTLYLIPTYEQAIGVLSSFDALGDNLSKKVAIEMITILLALIGLALFILDRLSTRITRPLVDLAAATETIKEGKYKQVSFPKVEKRKDEIGQLVRSFKEMTVELQEKEKIRTLLNKVVSKDIAEEILKSDVHLGGEDRIATILFADIRNFTEITQNMPPQKIVKMLNQAMTMISKVIEGEGGIIDKYVGDEVMALYGTPIHHPDHALRALASAKLMVESLKKWNIEREKTGEMAIEMGIGINTGVVVAGNMGAEDRLNYTVIGPSVNLASRLCKAALPQQIIISEFTLEEPGVKESFFVENLPLVALKGFKDPVKVFQVTGFKWESD